MPEDASFSRYNLVLLRAEARGQSRPGRSVALLWVALLLQGCGDSSSDQPPAAEAKSGRAIFEAYCAACHHPEGLGLAGGPPPLTASPWVSGPEGRLIRIVLHGVRGPMKVGSETYNLEMPGFGRILSDAQIAGVLSFVRRQFGGPSAPITAAAVSRIRAATRDRDTYWTVDELLEVR